MPTPNPLTRTVALLLAGLLAACSTPVDPDDSGSDPDPDPIPNVEAGTVTGTVRDTRGRPIANAKVWIKPALTTGLVETRTGADGRYRAEGLPNVPYYALAWTEVEYGGEPYCLRLGMPDASDYDSFVPTDGVVRNFRWQLTGVIEDLRDYDGYFGGEIRIFRYGNHEGGRLELTFTPTGPVIDGSTVAPFTRTVEPEDVMIYDVPVGEYRVTAAFVGAGGQAELRVGMESALDYESQTESALFAFEPLGCGNANGTDRGFLYVNSPVE